MQRAGVQVTPHTLLGVDVVFTALRVISNNIIKLGNQRAYKEALTEDNFPYRKYLAKQPSLLTSTFGGPRRMMQSTGWDRTIWSMALFGEVFWYIVLRDELQFATTLDVLHPAFMLIKSDPLTGEPIYEYGSGNKKVILDPEDVIHIPFKSLPAARRALNPVEYAGVAGALAMAAYEFGSTWFSQGTSPDFILTTDAKLGQEEVQRIAQKFLIEHGGLGQSHLPLVLDRGLKAEKVMASPDEAQYLNTLTVMRSVLFSWFGVEFLSADPLQRTTPPAPGAREDMMASFAQDTLSGYVVPLEEAMSSLLPAGVNSAWDEGKLSRPNAATLGAEVMAYRQSQTWTINELRGRKFQLGPIPGGDDALAPLASNVAPSQTDAQDAAKGDSKPPAPAVPAKAPVKASK